MMRRVVPQPCARLVARTPQPRMRLPAGQRRYSTESESVIFEVNRAGRVDELRRSIAAQPVERLPLAEFRKMAEKAGMSADEATGALDALHRSGSVLYLPSEVPDVVFTRPAAVRAAILNVIDPTGEVRLCLPLRPCCSDLISGQLAKARTAQLRADLAKIEAELKPLEEKQVELRKKAARSARRWAWFGAVYLTLQGAAVARLTWWEFSWDIMEVTYIPRLSA